MNIDISKQDLAVIEKHVEKRGMAVALLLDHVTEIDGVLARIVQQTKGGGT